jgi:soluble lytic murein transglycosylase-like protein
MATTTLSIPSAGLISPESWGTRESVKGIIQNIEAKYGKYFKFASETSRIPKPILMAFCAVESGGNPTAGSAGHITQGLMQWNRDFAKANLEDEYAKGRLSPAEKSKLAQYGIKFDKDGKTRTITNADQLKPELNILIASIILGQLVDTTWGTQNGVIRLDRVIAVYNAGAFGETGKKARLGNHKTPALLAADVNPTTRAYIKKILGKNGALEVATTDLKNQIA